MTGATGVPKTEDLMIAELPYFALILSMVLSIDLAFLHPDKT